VNPVNPFFQAGAIVRSAIAIAALVSLGPVVQADEMKPTATRNSEVLATVNGLPVPRSLLDILERTRAGNNPYDEQSAAADPGSSPTERAEIKTKAIADLVLTEAMAQHAQERGIDKRPEFIAEAELLVKTLLQQQLVREMIKDIKLDEAELMERYAAQQPERLYQVSHLLTRDEAAANALIKKLDQGASFSKLARRYSTDPQSRKDGALGWLMLNQMATAFAASVQTLTPGTYTKAAVNTPEGWHVILVQAVKDLPKPAFAEVRGSIRQALLVEKVNAGVQELGRQAVIKINK
jgi:peptidyl-prolyl cis-trans isomerase C